MAKSIKVLIAEDHDVVRAGLKILIRADPQLEVAGETNNGPEAVRLARAAQADVVLMDIRMPVLDGIAATRLITGDEDLAGVRVLILTTFEIDEYVFEALRAGASGFLGKGVEPNELISAIRLVAAGEALLSPTATRTLVAHFLADPNRARAVDHAQLSDLTVREREIMALVATGRSNREIAEQLTVSPLTVKTHVNRAMAKLGARDRAQLVVIAFQSGLASA